MRTFIVHAALFAACVRAISITVPTKDQVINLASQSFTVQWSTVNTDPTTAHLFLVNQQGGHTPYSQDLGSIDLTKGSYTVSAIAGLPADSGYQFNIQSVTSTNTGILAQSQQFNVSASSNSGAAESSPSSSSASTSTTTTTSGSTATTAASGSSSTQTGSSSATTMATVTPSASSSVTASSNGTVTTAGVSATKVATSSGSKVMGGSMLVLAIAGLALMA